MPWEIFQQFKNKKCLTSKTNKNPINKNLAECNCYTIEFAGMTHRTRKKTGEGWFMMDVDVMVIVHLMKIQGWIMRIENRLQG